ncbi:NUDIX domain-containing protein [Nocardia sp. alder85J]|uniref:NUDIX domain-containing protein n=1 Tax=Nocardia sp. alder85J TaxID=2862949 RepID=UPI001CD6BC58|nr:NUDIX hydrolase [Nocardia sp. alder85J]MCX4095681.1 NUDIX hydrolase [Nocardia sp. alder85J]
MVDPGQRRAVLALVVDQVGLGRGMVGHQQVRGARTQWPVQRAQRLGRRWCLADLLGGGEDPRDTVLREAGEELAIDARFHPQFGCDPLFLSVTETRGAHSHTDVTFWFVLEGKEGMPVEVDAREANSVRWFALDDPAVWAGDRFDPHMTRFRHKLLTWQGYPPPVNN